jgi:type IX secretion system PorP/SprF family membrane protein
MKKLYVFVFAFICFSSGLRAQDSHFSQFFSSPLTLNPAFTGKFDGVLRVAGNYRNQWPAFGNAYTTGTISVDLPILRGKLPEMDTWGIGILGLTDKAAQGILVTNYVGLSTAYHKALDENGFQMISAGFMATFGQKRLDVSKLIFEDQLTSTGFNLSVPSAEIPTLTNPNIKYVDVDAGLIFSSSTSADNNFYIGASMYHLNKPKESFKGGTWNIGTRSTVTAGGFFPITNMLTLHTSGIFQIQNKATETVFGGALAAKVTGEDASISATVYAGSWLRIKDAIIPYIGLEFNGLRLGATYDINTSSLKTASQSRGGMEISLIYIKPAPEPRGIPCPKF